MKINRGANFVGVFEYILDMDKRPELIALDNVDPRQYAREIPSAKSLGYEMQNEASSNNSKAEKPVWHAQISFAKDDESLLTEDLIQNIASDFVDSIGAKDHQFAVVKHNDTAHQHLHIVINRVNHVTGKCLSVKEGMDKKFVMNLSKKLEKKYNLTQAISASRTYTTKELKNYKYAHKPNKQVLKQVLSNALKDIRRHEFSSEAQLKKYLKSIGMKIVTVTNDQSKQGKGNRKFKAIQYKFKYFDNKTKKHRDDTFTLKFSTIQKGLSYTKLLNEIKTNYSNKESKVQEMSCAINDLNKEHDLKNHHKKDIYSLLAFAGIDLQKSYSNESINKLDNNVVAEMLSDIIDHKDFYSVTGLELKKDIYQSNDISKHLIKGLQFNFNMIEAEFLGKEKIKAFYKSYLNSLSPEIETNNPLFLNVLSNKRPNHHTLNFVIEQVTGTKTGYDFRDVNPVTAKILFNTLKKPELRKSDIFNKIEAAVLINNANKSFMASKNILSSKDIVKLLAKRGVKVTNSKGIFELHYANKNMGMASSFGMDMFNKSSEERITFNNQELENIFNKNYNPSNNHLYQLLDSKDFKGLNLEIKKGKKFKIDDFDKAALSPDFANKINEMFTKASYRKLKK